MKTYLIKIVLLVLLTLLVACSNDAPAAQPTAVPAAEQTTEATEIAVEATVAVATDAPATDAPVVPEATEVDLDAAKDTLKGLLSEADDENAGAKQYEDVIAFSYPEAWLLIASADGREVKIGEDSDADRPMLIRFEIVTDEAEQFELIGEGLLSNTSRDAVADENSDTGTEGAGAGDSADLFGETYLQLQRAVYQNDQLILLTGMGSLDASSELRPIFEAVVNSMQ